MIEKIPLPVDFSPPCFAMAAYQEGSGIIGPSFAKLPSVTRFERRLLMNAVAGESDS